MNQWADFRDRFAVESFPGGDGVLVDLCTGSYFRLNASAVTICEALRLADALDDAVERVGGALGVSATEAKRLVAAVKDDIDKGMTPEEVLGPFHFTTRPDGSCLFLEDGGTIFSVDRASQTFRFHASLKDLKVPLALYLRSFMPKLLARLGVPILHAAACSMRQGLVAFSGKSGAGKTTTAREFARAGVPLVSEDILVLRLANGLPEVFTAGEGFARRWADETAGRLERSPSEEVNFEELRGAASGPTMPLAEIWFVAASRRASNAIELRSLSIGDGVATLLGNGFLASSRPDHWREFFRRARLIAERTNLSEATMPDGLQRLREGARRYIVNSAS